jgi:hypothetical protein
MGLGLNHELHAAHWTGLTEVGSGKHHTRIKSFARSPQLGQDGPDS